MLTVHFFRVHLRQKRKAMKFNNAYFYGYYFYFTSKSRD